MKYCVQCGKTASWFVSNRCGTCYDAWKKAGKIIATPWVKETPGYPAVGIRTGGTAYSNHALFCRECGGKIPPKCDRQLYALKKGGECVRCDDCYYENHPREILRRPRSNPLPPAPHVPRLPPVQDN